MSETKNIPLYRLRNPEEQEALLQWWNELHRKNQKGVLNKNGVRAELRRCSTPEEAALHPETYTLQEILPWIPIESAATITGILAHVNAGEQDKIGFAGKLAKPKHKGDKSPYSESRFRKLVTTSDYNEFYTLLRRAVQLLDGNVHPLSVADVIIQKIFELKGKNHPTVGKSVTFNLSKEYYTELLKS